MGRLIEEVTITSPPRRVWRIIEKHLEHPETSPDSQESGDIREGPGEPLTKQRSGVGTRTRWHYTYHGKPFVWDDVVTEWIPEERVTWESTSGWNMKDSFSLSSLAGGSQTSLAYYMTYRLPYSILGIIYARLILEPRMRTHLRRVLVRIKSLSETPFQQSIE